MHTIAGTLHRCDLFRAEKFQYAYHCFVYVLRNRPDNDGSDNELTSQRSAAMLSQGMRQIVICKYLIE